MPRGSTLTLPDGRVVCFIGGAKSVDHPLRSKGRNWFEEEVLGPEVLDHLPERADIVISHTAPRSLGIAAELSKGRSAEDWRAAGWDVSPDPSEEVLDQVKARLKPKLWYFGHFHRTKRYWGGTVRLPSSRRSAMKDPGPGCRSRKRTCGVKSSTRAPGRGGAGPNPDLGAGGPGHLAADAQGPERSWPWLKTFHVDDLTALSNALEEGSREIELVRRVMASREGGAAMLNKHHADYLETCTNADVWDERELPPGPFQRRKLVVYYTQGSWIWARAEKGGPALLLAQYDTWKPG